MPELLSLRWVRRRAPVAAVENDTSGADKAASSLAPQTTPRQSTRRWPGTIPTRLWQLLARPDVGWWLLAAIVLGGLALRLYGLNWDANNHLHPDERQIVFRAMCLGFPGTPRPGTCDPAYTGPGWLLSPASPLNPHFFAYGSFPLYLLAAVAHGLARLTQLTGGQFLPPDGGAWDDFNHFTLVGRALSALFDAGSILVGGLIARRLAGRWTGVLAAAFIATIPFEVQVAHFYAVDTVMLFFILLTLLGCLMLVQGVGVPERGGDPLEPREAAWWAWRLGALIGVSFALALATKVSAVPLLAPVVAALLITWRRYGFDALLLAAMGAGSAGVASFLLVSPYTLIDWRNFQAQVTEQTMLSQGKLDYPYVRQFADTAPYVYPLRQLLLYDMGLPLGLLGLAGFGWALRRVWRRLDSDWTPLVVFIAGYFAVVGGAYMKFSRYMLPVFAGLAICGAAAVVALAGRGLAHTSGDGAATHQPRWRVMVVAVSIRASAFWGPRWWRGVCVAFGLGVLLASTFASLALVNIYSAPNTRVQASEWIYDHIRPGSVLTNEVWDDPLPIQVPAARTAQGIGYTAAGNPIAPGAYGQIGLNLYDDDTAEKADQLAQSLASADVVVISSQRLIGSIPKLPDRYPMTTRYYSLLFAGKLGFRLAARFETQPNLLGLTLDDRGADESFSVYDHPPVWIFVKDGAGLSERQLKAALTNGMSLPAASRRSGSEKSLLLSPQNAAADAQSPALYAQFPLDSLANRAPLLWWLLVVELLGLIAFPLAFVAFPGLHDRGWGLTKLLGLLVLSYVVWLSASLKIFPFDRWFVLVALGMMLAGSALLAWWRRAAIWRFVGARWRTVAVCEALFLVAFLAFTWIRAADPNLWDIYRGGEKPMELAFLNGILRSRYLPPLDPWFSGGYINYYYYGQFLFAVLIKLTGIVPTVAFNLAIPLLFAMTCTGAFSVVAGMTRRWWAGLAGAVGLASIGNLDGLLQLIDQWRATLAGQTPPLFDYWRSSRVIPFTINEFPFWSFLYADLHAHVIDLPVVVLIMAACASLLRGRSVFGPRWRAAIPTLAVVALALGAAWGINTWDVPTFGLLVALVLAVRLLPAGSEKRGWTTLREALRWEHSRGYLLAAGATLGAAYVLYLPFHANFQSFVSGTGPVKVATDPRLFATVFGLWLFLMASFYFVELRDRWERLVASGSWLTVGSPRSRLVVLVAGWAAVLTFAVLLSVKALLVVFLVVGLYLALDMRHTAAKWLTYLLLLTGCAVALGVELIYVRDFLDNSDWERMNTVFKFYYQVWTLFALGGVLALTFVLPRLASGFSRFSSSVAGAWEHMTTDGASPTVKRGVRIRGISGLLAASWTVTLMALLIGSLVFIAEGTQVRVQDPSIWAAVQPPPGGVQPRGLSLDGMAYMRGWYPSDYMAITWLNAHVAGAPTIVEASGGYPYTWYGRVSIYTGLPAVLGWSNHESQQRYSDQVFARQNDVETFYETADPAGAVAFLRRYNVQLVYLGQLERTCYSMSDYLKCVPMPADGLAKFTTLERSGILRPVYQTRDVTIYQVVSYG